MEENSRLIHECALAGGLHLVERLERGGVEVPKHLREDVITAVRASIETYIVERNRMLRRLYPLGGN